MRKERLKQKEKEEDKEDKEDGVEGNKDKKTYAYLSLENGCIPFSVDILSPSPVTP